MKKVIFILCTLVIVVANAQPPTYQADIKALRAVIQKTPSYKSQIKKQKLSYYNSLYDRLIADSTNDPDQYSYFYNLSQLLFPLRDNHIGFYQLPDYANFKDKQSIDKYVQTKEFSKYPFCALNTDSLKSVLSQKPAESVEGIYYYDKFYTVGLFMTKAKEYIGVVLDSKINLWTKGQVAIHLYEQEPGLYKAIYGHPLTKNFIFQPIEKYRNLSLVNSFFYSSYSSGIYTKEPGNADFVNIAAGSQNFDLKAVEKDIQYLLLKSFQANNKTSKESEHFYDSIKNKLVAPALILDLRNNEGGARKESKKYLKLLKDYSRKGKIYVLINNGTLSQAEIFLLSLKEFQAVTVVGQTTKGMLTYGSNYGKTEKLPGKRFAIYPTDMRGPDRLLKYEDYGIDPDISLGKDKDWIQQTIAIIKAKQ